MGRRVCYGIVNYKWALGALIRVAQHSNHPLNKIRSQTSLLGRLVLHKLYNIDFSDQDGRAPISLGILNVQSREYGVYYLDSFTSSTFSNT